MLDRAAAPAAVRGYAAAVHEDRTYFFGHSPGASERADR
jgi:hypothetical protein